MELQLGTPEFNNYGEQYESRKALELYATENYRSETNQYEESPHLPKKKKQIK